MYAFNKPIKEQIQGFFLNLENQEKNPKTKQTEFQNLIGEKKKRS